MPYKKTSFILFLLTFLSQHFLLAQTISLVSSNVIIENPPFNECHASSIVEVAKGHLMATWFAGTRESNPDVTIWVADYKNGQWQSFRTVADGIINDSLRFPCWNPVLFKTAAGKLFLFYKVGKNPRTWWGMMKFSTNNGKTWSKAERLPKDFLGPIKNKPIQLANGDLLHPSSTESLDEKVWQIHLEKCDKNARNWQRINLANDTFSVIQPTILRYSKQKLQLLNRSRHNKIIQSWSYDNGKTWQKLSALNMPNPNSGFDAASLKNGWQMMVHNPLISGKHWSEGRNKLIVSISKNGLDWQEIYVLEDASKGEFSYPAIIQSLDGLIHITYTLNRKNIKHVVLKMN